MSASKKVLMSNLTSSTLFLSISNVQKEIRAQNESVPAYISFILAQNGIALSNAFRLYQEKRQEICKKYCELNESGEFVFDEQGAAKYKSTQDQKDCENQLLRLMNTSSLVAIYPFKDIILNLQKTPFQAKESVLEELWTIVNTLNEF